MTSIRFEQPLVPDTLDQRILQTPVSTQRISFDGIEIPIVSSKDHLTRGVQTPYVLFGEVVHRYVDNAPYSPHKGTTEEKHTAGWMIGFHRDPQYRMYEPFLGGSVNSLMMSISNHVDCPEDHVQIFLPLTLRNVTKITPLDDKASKDHEIPTVDPTLAADASAHEGSYLPYPNFPVDHIAIASSKGNMRVLYVSGISDVVRSESSILYNTAAYGEDVHLRGAMSVPIKSFDEYRILKVIERTRV